jgi:hypothetical protein
MSDKIKTIQARDIDTDEIINVYNIESITNIVCQLEKLRGDIDLIKIILEERREKIFNDDRDES